MTIFAAIRNLTFLARDVFEAALYLIPAPGLSGYDDERAPWWAEELAEREAAEECSEPQDDCGLVGHFAFGTNQYMPLPYAQYPEPCGCDCECPPDCHGSWDDWDDDPIADCHVPNPDDFDEPPLNSDELAAVRQLIEERFPHAPVASASSPTPADATGLTLANDPQSVHDRHMRRLLGEDK